MKIGLFLGAGASAPFGMPPTVELRNKLQKFTYNDVEEEILQSFLTESKFLDIEYVLQAVRDIIEFSRSKGGNYFFTHGKDGIFRYQKGTVPFDTFINKVVQAETSLEDFVYENYRWKTSSEELLLQIYDKIIEFLKNHSNSVNIFTTNYDRVIEEYCRLREKYQCIDGFERQPPHSEISQWTGNFNVKKNPNGPENIYLYKLHGSLNWKERANYGIVKTLEEGKTPDLNFIRNLVVMPTLSPKIEEEQDPFKTIISNFIKFMKNADACIVIGFSFRDDRLNGIFKSFIENGKVLIIISPSSMEKTCKNLLKVDVPKDFDKSMVIKHAPIDGNVWCIPHKLDEKSIPHDLEIAWANIKNTIEPQTN